VTAELHHVGIVCRGEEAAERLAHVLGLEEVYRGYVPEYHALCIFCGQIELVVPDPGTRLAHGPGGLHHIALRVEDVEAVAERYAAQGMPLLERTPVRGAGDFRINFLSPLYTGGVVVEFVEVDRISES